MSRYLAHSYRDEIPAPRRPIEPIITGWREVGEILLGVAVLATLLLGIPFLLWLAWTPA